MGDHNELGKSITNFVRKLAAASKLRFVCPQEGNKAFKTSFGFKHHPRPRRNSPGLDWKLERGNFQTKMALLSNGV